MGRVAEILTRWEWLILLLSAPILFFPTGWRGLFLLVIPLLWLMRKIARGYFFPHTPYDVSLLAMITALLISLAAVFDMALSFPKIAGLILGIAFFYAGVQYAREKEQGAYYIVGLVICLGTAMVIVGLLGSIRSAYYNLLTPLSNLIPTAIDPYLKILDNAVNPNELAGILSWVLPLLAAITIGFGVPLLRSPSWWQKLIPFILVILLLFNTYIMLATKSRGGILAVVLGLLVMIAVQFRWGKWVFLLVFISAIAASFYFDLGTMLQGDAATAVDLGMQGRLEIWSRALYGLADFPVTGMGMNGFRQIVHVLYPLFSIDPTFDIGHAHNQLLQAGLDLGFLGLIAFLSIWILCVVLLWQSWQGSPGINSDVLILGLSGSMTAGWIFGIFDTIALGARPGFLWWLLLALVVAVFDQAQEESTIETGMIQTSAS